MAERDDRPMLPPAHRRGARQAIDRSIEFGLNRKILVSRVDPRGAASVVRGVVPRPPRVRVASGFGSENATTPGT
jgi:hypothetical protein